MKQDRETWQNKAQKHADDKGGNEQRQSIG